MDAEFQNLKTAIDSIVLLLNLVSRDDGKVANRSVGVDQLQDELIKFIVGQDLRWNLKGAWKSGASYKYGDIVENGTYAYICPVDHTAGTSFTNDKGAGMWQVLSSDTGTYATPAYIDLQVANMQAYVLSQMSMYELIAHAAATYATLASPTFTGTVTVPTVDLTDASTVKAVNLAALLSLKGAANTWTKSQNVAAVDLTFQSPITTDASLGNVFNVTLGGNVQLANPTNLVSGGTYIWNINQDGTGSRVLTYGSLFKFPTGVAPALTTTAGAKDSLTAVYDGSILRCAIVKDFR